MILNKKQKISSGFTGTDCNLSVLGAFQIIQDAITEMTGLNGVDGVTIKQKFNAFWVFTKTRIKFFKRIVWNSEAFIRCFISSVSAIRMDVIVEIRDGEGEIAARSKTELCAIDFPTQRILKLSAVGVNVDMCEKDGDDISFVKFESADMPLAERVKVRSTNIDFSHHTNNLEYVRIIMNTYSVAETESKPVKEIEIAYVSQSYEGDVLEIKKAGIENKDLLVIEKEGKPVVKCEIVY